MFEDTQLAHLFPEWQLSYALYEWSRCDPADRLWNKQVVHTIDRLNTSRSLEEIYGNAEQLSFHHQEWLPTNGGKLYGIENNDYSRFVGLIPDFRLETSDKSLIIILEAKSGIKVPPSSRPLKEHLYLQFLEKASIPRRKGFFFLVPDKTTNGYLELLKRQARPEGALVLGIISWENLLDLICDHLIKQALGQLLNITNGLRRLRTWRKHH